VLTLPYVVSAVFELSLMILAIYRFYKSFHEKPTLADVAIMLLAGFFTQMAFPVAYRFPVIYYNDTIGNISKVVVNIPSEDVIWNIQIFRLIPWLFFGLAFLTLTYYIFYQWYRAVEEVESGAYKRR